MPQTKMVSETEELVTVDGKSFTRTVPKIFTVKGATGETIAEMAHRPPGSRDVNLRLRDLDEEGIWAEVMYQSIGLWCSLIEDPQLIRDAARAENEWLASEIQSVAPDRLVPAALMPMLSVEDAVGECEHAAEIGLHELRLDRADGKVATVGRLVDLVKVRTGVIEIAASRLEPPDRLVRERKGELAGDAVDHGRVDHLTAARHAALEQRGGDSEGHEHPAAAIIGSQVERKHRPLSGAAKSAKRADDRQVVHIVAHVARHGSVLAPARHAGVDETGVAGGALVRT